MYRHRSGRDQSGERGATATREQTITCIKICPLDPVMAPKTQFCLLARTISLAPFPARLAPFPVRLAPDRDVMATSPDEAEGKISSRM